MRETKNHTRQSITSTDHANRSRQPITPTDYANRSSQGRERGRCWRFIQHATLSTQHATPQHTSPDRVTPNNNHNTPIPIPILNSPRAGLAGKLHHNHPRSTSESPPPPYPRLPHHARNPSRNRLRISGSSKPSYSSRRNHRPD